MELKDTYRDLCREILVNGVVTSEFFVPGYARRRNLVHLVLVLQCPAGMRVYLAVS